LNDAARRLSRAAVRAAVRRRWPACAV